eukprot:7381902-Prymnesium_polylepis.1
MQSLALRSQLPGPHPAAPQSSRRAVEAMCDRSGRWTGATVRASRARASRATRAATHIQSPRCFRLHRRNQPDHHRIETAPKHLPATCDLTSWQGMATAGRA